MNVLITGGTGFIGSRLALKCIENGCDVKVLGLENTPAESFNKKVIEEMGAQVILCSVLDKEAVFEHTKGIDVVYHLAATQHEMNVPDQKFWDVNVTGTRNLLEASATAQIKCFVHGSTIGVYGIPNGVLDEESSCNPENIYGVTKLAGEELVLSFKDKLPVVIIRIPEVYGPGDRRLLKLFKMINKNTFFMIGNGENFHHLIYIDDLIQALLLAPEKDEAAGEVILLAGEKPVSTNEMVSTIAEQFGAKGSRFRVPFGPLYLLAATMEFALRPIGIQPPLHRRRMDFFKKSFHLSWQKAAEVLGYRPEVSFKEGVLQTANWYESMRLIENDSPVAAEMSPDKVEELPSLDSKFNLTARIEPFDSFWEAPDNIEKGYAKFGTFYRHNYLKHFPENRGGKILVISCGPGYMVKLLNQEGYFDVLGIDSMPEKLAYAAAKNLNCRAARAFDYLAENNDPYDVIFCEQEINHLTKEEILVLLDLCQKNLRDNGKLIMHSLNGANPIVGAENLALNLDHYNTFTKQSMVQILEYANFDNINIFPLKLYVFYKNPLNYVGIFVESMLSFLFRICFIFYGKSNKIFTKKIAAVCRKRI